MDTSLLFSPEQKLRMIEEYVPGKQITLAHIIANPDASLFDTMGFTPVGDPAIGIVTITPGEAALIMGDIAIKASGAKVSFLDRADGAMILTGSVSQVETSLQALVAYAEEKLHFSVCEITRT